MIIDFLFLFFFSPELASLSLSLFKDLIINKLLHKSLLEETCKTFSSLYKLEHLLSHFAPAVCVCNIAISVSLLNVTFIISNQLNSISSNSVTLFASLTAPWYSELSLPSYHTGTRGNRLPSNSAYLFWLATRTIADADSTALVPICSRGLPSVILHNLHFVPYQFLRRKLPVNGLPVGETVLADLITLRNSPSRRAEWLWWPTDTTSRYH